MLQKEPIESIGCDLTKKKKKKKKRFSNFQVIDHSHSNGGYHGNYITYSSEPVHQYVTSFGAPYVPHGFSHHHHDYPTAPWAFPPPPPHPDFHPEVHETVVIQADHSPPNKFTRTLQLLNQLIPLPNTMDLLIKFTLVLVSLFGIAVFGGAITTGICSFTPLCSISFATLSMRRQKDKNPLIVDATKTQRKARVRRAAKMLNAALQKYQTNNK